MSHDECGLLLILPGLAIHYRSSFRAHLEMSIMCLSGTSIPDARDSDDLSDDQPDQDMVLALAATTPNSTDQVGENDLFKAPDGGPEMTTVN